MKHLVIVLAIVLLAISSAICAPSKGELTFSASLFNANEGPTVWSGTGEYLIPIGHHLLFGPSVALFDAGETDGGSVGVAGEVNIGGGKCGPGFGAAVYRPLGDAADLADYTGEARVFFKCGSEHAFVKFTGTQTWSKNADGAVTDPDGTKVLAGLGWRF
jgi:hypothetical protein